MAWGCCKALIDMAILTITLQNIADSPTILLTGTLRYVKLTALTVFNNSL